MRLIREVPAPQAHVTRCHAAWRTVIAGHAARVLSLSADDLLPG